MAILLISGPAKSGKSYLANALRNGASAQKRGVLMLDESTTGDPKHLLEKLISELTFEDCMRLAAVKGIGKEKLIEVIPWKPDPVVIAVGDREKLLDDFERAIPGFRAKMGPVFTCTTGRP